MKLSRLNAFIFCTILFFAFTVEAAAQTITLTGSLSPFASNSGSPGASQSFAVSGTGLSNSIYIYPPYGFEVSTSSSFTTVGNRNTPLILPLTGSTVSSTAIYVRIPSSASGFLTGYINVASAGAPSQNIDVYGIANQAASLTLGPNPAVCASSTATTANLLFSGLRGYAQGIKATSQTFSYTGSVQTFTVPQDVSSLHIDASGAQGGTYVSSSPRAAGGNGGRVQAIYSVNPGMTLNIYVGGAGGNGYVVNSGSGSNAGGWNGGGTGAVNNPTHTGSGGGGATDIRVGGTGLSNRILVAGGGGGGAKYYLPIFGGPGGDLTGGDGQIGRYFSGTAGLGGTQSAGGAGSVLGSTPPGGNGSLGQGGNGGNDIGPGGGGGYYGGGGGTGTSGSSSAGGGSSYADPALVSVVHTQGYNAGDGNLTVTYYMPTTMPMTYSITWDSGPLANIAPGTAFPKNSPIAIPIPANTTAGTYTGTLALDNGAGPTNYPVSVTVNGQTISLGTISDVSSTATSFAIPYTGATGSPDQYSIVAASPVAMPGFNSVVNAALGSSPLTVPIPAGQPGTYNYNFSITNSHTGCVSDTYPLTLTVLNPPTITTSGSLSTLTTDYGLPSINQTTFTIAGSFLTGDIKLAAPTGFELSTNASYGYVRNLVLTQTNGIVNSTIIYARLSATAQVANSPYSGNIVCSSIGATSQNVATLPSSVYPVNLTITTKDTSKNYGSALAVANGSTLFTASGLKNGETVGSVTLTFGAGSAANAAVGTYSGSVVASAPSGGTFTASNYTISYVNGAIVVNPVTLTVSANPQTRIYGSTDPVLTYMASGLVNDENSSVFTGSLTRDAGENVGNYTINAGSLSAGGNYTISYTGNQFTITPASLTVTAGPQTKVFGMVDPALTYTATGFVNSDNSAVLTGSLSRLTGENAGSYPINIGSLSAGRNYAISYTGNQFTITPASLTVTADARTKAYGAADPLLTYTASGFVNGGNNSLLTGTLSRAAGEDVGNYAINLGTLSAGGNYSITYTGNFLTITRIPQQISWVQNLVAGCGGAAPPTLNAVSSSGLPVSYTVSNTAVASISGNQLTLLQPGMTVITASQSGNNNYSPAVAVTNTLNFRSTTLVRTHWNDALLFDNTSGNYVSWQWYKSGSAIAGATAPYFSEGTPLSGQYYVVAVDKNNGSVQSCPLTLTPGAAVGGITVSPNPVHSRTMFTVAANYTDAQLQGAKLSVITVTGTIVAQLTTVHPTNSISAPTGSGIYIISLQLSNGQKVSTNLLVN
ncbi:MAG: hypothetical protein J0H74_21590 [Chitinophagaceae bacterium]|nr:hypothetical protein [Chitinophagaceae bacterium]